MPSDLLLSKSRKALKQIKKGAFGFEYQVDIYIIIHTIR